MREIRFRAWDTRVKDWLNDDTLESCIVFRKKGELIISDRFKLMQFTGLRDTDGKEIYEGDIVKLICNCVGEVRFEHGEFQVYLKRDMIFVHMRCNPITSWSFKSEVIGNIYENPELLKKEDSN